MSVRLGPDQNCASGQGSDTSPPPRRASTFFDLRWDRELRSFQVFSLSYALYAGGEGWGRGGRLMPLPPNLISVNTRHGTQCKPTEVP